jgi:hypothetical protein
MNLFINNIEESYRNITIYRAIIVTTDNNETMLLSKKLDLLNHDPYCIYEDDNYEIDYNYRLYIVNKDLFINFLKNINKDSYNFIAISFNIINKDLDNITEYILDNTDNNIHILNHNTYTNSIMR